MKLSTALLLVASISAVAGQELYGPEYYGPQRRHLTKSEKGGVSGSARKGTGETASGSAKSGKDRSTEIEEESGSGSAKARKRHLESKATSGGSSSTKSSSSKKSSSRSGRRGRSSSSSTSSDDYFRGFRGWHGFRGGSGRRQDCDIVVKLADYDTRTTRCADLIEDRIATTYPGLRVIEDSYCGSNVRCLPIRKVRVCVVYHKLI